MLENLDFLQGGENNNNNEGKVFVASHPGHFMKLIPKQAALLETMDAKVHKIALARVRI